jgi:anti-sigma regulatory factor (Ser/Thr protein kinase)
MSLCAKPICLDVFSYPGHLSLIRTVVEKCGELAGLDREVIDGIVLSVDEAIANIIRHAYDGAEDQPIKIELTPFRDAQSKGLRIRLRDYGHSVDPSIIKSRDLNDVRPGGLGVHIMKTCMDRVEYFPAEDGGTWLLMEKRIENTQETIK